MAITKGILGIDPGASGAFVLLSREGAILEKHVMPVAEGGGLDLVSLSRLFFWLSDRAIFTYMEKVHAMPHQGVVSMFSFGVSYGTLLGHLASFRMPFRLVPPQEWQKVVHQDVDSKLPGKLRSAMASKQLFPNEDLRADARKKINHDGIVDALLIAEFGRREQVFYAGASR
ncbi:MAG: hypothetical protein ACXWPM_06775 [Bdellovibrionota bacterium]